MLIKKVIDQIVVTTPTCGEIREILKNQDYAPLGIAIAINIQPTEGHYHQTFDEIYFVLDGSVELKLYDPSLDKITGHTLHANELCVITKGIHHKIIKVSPENRLCVISAPPFHADDEHSSNKI